MSLVITRDITFENLSTEMQESIVEEVKDHIVSEYPKEEGETAEEYETYTNERVDHWLNTNYTINGFEMGE